MYRVIFEMVFMDGAKGFVCVGEYKKKRDATLRMEEFYKIVSSNDYVYYQGELVRSYMIYALSERKFRELFRIRFEVNTLELERRLRETQQISKKDL